MQPCSRLLQVLRVLMEIMKMRSQGVPNIHGEVDEAAVANVDRYHDLRSSPVVEVEAPHHLQTEILFV